MWTKRTVTDLLSSSDIVIFSKSYCPHCADAKRTARRLSRDMRILEVDLEDDSVNLQEIICSLTSMQTFPQVFYQQKLIGGNSDFQRYCRYF